MFAVAVVLLSLFPVCAMATEEPKFDVVTKDGDIELRQYAPMVVAETFVDGSQDDASSRGFRVIAGYIFGDNKRAGQSAEKIAMTAPVTIERQVLAKNRDDRTGDAGAAGQSLAGSLRDAIRVQARGFAEAQQHGCDAARDPGSQSRRLAFFRVCR